MGPRRRHRAFQRSIPLPRAPRCKSQEAMTSKGEKHARRKTGSSAPRERAAEDGEQLQRVPVFGPLRCRSKCCGRERRVGDQKRGILNWSWRGKERRENAEKIQQFAYYLF